VSRTALVLGSNSFSGSHAVEALLGVYERVVGVSRSPEKSPLFLPYKGREGGRFEFHQVDMVSQPQRLVELCDRLRPEVVLNFASLVEVAPSNDHPGDYFLTNCVALADLVDSLRRRDYLRLFVQISTPEVYGSCPQPLREDAPYNPSTPYAASKAGADLLLHALHKTFGFPVIYVRATNYYGRHQQLFKLMPRAVIRMRRGIPLELHGGGRAVKTWIHVRDVARALLAVLERGKVGSVYHLTDANVYSVAEVVRFLCRFTGVAFEEAVRVVEERPGQDARYLLDDSRARSELGWQPREDFEQGVAEVVEWIDANWEEVLRHPQAYAHQSPR
jgi:dTDP-glucose 4,6-dehydratase